MVKQEHVKKFVKTILGCILIAVIICSALYWFLTIYEEDCLENMATDYCLEKNLSYFDKFPGKFRCREQGDLRTNPYGEVSRFYYLPEEEESCLIKNGKSWRRV